ncbi:MAG: T9SS type A sorting domain-containing protein [Sphingobacteriales bacterium JAD_PAG50586_3]|nr:MAG: T9SS type A sorting domain-containing protein [Sphingobacteriales bacterium JAD_PAG50586_3]
MPPANADTINLINIRDWNFGWQGSYQFQYAQPIEQGSVLRAVTTYDNTVNNPYNPSSPPQDVTVGESTDEEMMLTFFGYAMYQPGDENILMDSTLATSTPQIPSAQLNVSLFPNPTTNTVFIDIPNDNDAYTLTLYNQLGQAILSRQLQQDGWVDVSGIASGIYISSISSTKGIYTQKLIKY